MITTTTAITIIAALILLYGAVSWMSAQERKYRNHPDRSLWNRSNEQILDEIEAERVRIEAENVKNGV